MPQFDTPKVGGEFWGVLSPKYLRDTPKIFRGGVSYLGGGGLLAAALEEGAVAAALGFRLPPLSGDPHGVTGGRWGGGWLGAERPGGGEERGVRTPKY